MKNKHVGSFATAKLQAKRHSLLAIALVAVIGFSCASCKEPDEDESDVVSGDHNYYNSAKGIVYLRYGIVNNVPVWTSSGGLRLTNPPRTGTTYTISGTVDKDLRGLRLLVLAYKRTGATTSSSYVIGTVTPNSVNIPAGKFEKTFTLSNINYPADESNDYILRLQNHSTTGSITPGTFATISDFSLTINSP